MKCNKCGAQLIKSDFCPECHADVSFYKKCALASNTYYNKGLEQAHARDLSGAVDSLRMSVMLDKTNISARNLLGLCLFEMGEAVEGLSQWIVSKEFRSVSNPATDYIDEVQAKRTDFDDKCAAARKYNQVIENVNNENYDMAMIQLKKIVSQYPAFLKAQVLLSLFYMKRKAYARAEKCLKYVLKVDEGNTLAKKYLKEIKALEHDSADRKRIDEDTPAFLRTTAAESTKTDREPLSGNDVIIPKSGIRGGGITSLISTLIGIGIGAALIFFLIVPARERIVASRYENSVSDYSNDISGLNQQLSQSNKQVEEITAQRDALQAQLDEINGGEGAAYQSLIEAANKYLEDDMSGTAASIALVKKNVDILTGDALELYEFLSGETRGMSEDLFDEAMSAFNGYEIKRASELFEAAYASDPDLAEAAYYAARCYQSMSNDEKATQYYRIIVEDFPDSEYADTAQEYLDMTQS